MSTHRDFEVVGVRGPVDADRLARLLDAATGDGIVVDLTRATLARPGDARALVRTSPAVVAVTADPAMTELLESNGVEVTTSVFMARATLIVDLAPDAPRRRAHAAA